MFRDGWDYESIIKIKTCPFHHIEYRVCDYNCRVCKYPNANYRSMIHNRCYENHGYTSEEWQHTIQQLQHKIYQKTKQKIDYAKLWHAIEDNALDFNIYKMFVNLLPRKPTLRCQNILVDSNIPGKEPFYATRYYDDYNYSKKSLLAEVYDRKAKFDYTATKQKHIARDTEKKMLWAEKRVSRQHKNDVDY